MVLCIAVVALPCFGGGGYKSDKKIRGGGKETAMKQLRPYLHCYPNCETEISFKQALTEC